MFGIGIWEIVVILVVVMIFVRPDDLPGLARKAGVIVGRLRKAYHDLTDMIKMPDDKEDPGARTNKDSNNNDKEPS